MSCSCYAINRRYRGTGKPGFGPQKIMHYKFKRLAEEEEEEDRKFVSRMRLYLKIFNQ